MAASTSCTRDTSSLLRQAAAACDRLIVALNSDASVSQLKGPERPVQAEAVRAAVMAAVKGVDAVVIFGEQTPEAIIRELQPDVLVKGADYAEDQIVGADIVRARGGRIVRVTPGRWPVDHENHREIEARIGAAGPYSLP